MLKNYFKTAFRYLKRHTSNSIINISGLAVGIAACVLLFTVVMYELSYDTFQKNYKHIYRVVTTDKYSDGESYTAGTQTPFANALRVSEPQLKVANFNLNFGSQFTVINKVNVASSEKKFKEDAGVTFADAQYFDLFNSKWLTGSAAVLAQPNMVVLDKSTAIKYFGDWKNAIGQFLKMDNLATLKVAGIIEDAPENTDLPFKIYISLITSKQFGNRYGYNDNWNNTSSNNQVFVLLPENVSVQSVNNALKGLVKKYMGDQRNIQQIMTLQPLSDLHFNARYGITSGTHIISKSMLLMLSLIGILIIVMASINFINLSTAQAVGRAKEAGVRKVLGSNRSQLIMQVITETFLIVFCSVMLAVLIAYLSLPYLSHIANVPTNISLFTLKNILFLITVIVAVTVLSGIYPAFIISSFKPAVALKTKINITNVGGVSLKRLLVIVQFSVSQVLVIATIIAISQMNYIRNANLGFNKNAVYITPNISDSISVLKFNALKQQLLQNPNIKSVSFSSDAPSSDNNWSTNFYFNHSEKDPDFNTSLKYGDADYIKTFGIQLLAGRNVEPSDTAREFIINETLMKKLGYTDPEKIIGKDIRLGTQTWLPVVAVMKDFKTGSLRENVKPIVFTTNKNSYLNIGFKLSTNNLPSTIKFIQKLWQQTYPEYVYSGSFLDENIDQFYEQENKLELVFKIFAVLAIFISCLGLYGLVSFMATQKTKEIGIRKVLGASVASIIYLFSKEFTVLIVIAFAVAVPVAYYFMSNWLNNFAFRINITVWVFLLAIVSSVVIAWITVGYRSLKAALANPVKSLRTE